jgi:mannose-1-phosphate guanylyltransferase/mannose-6-phosphate isomerase
MKFLILAGGTGSRLWPLSTKEKPKQFQSFISEKSLLQEAYDRLDFANPDDIFVATNIEYKDLVQEQLANLKPHQIILEPVLKDTGPSMAFAIKYLQTLFGNKETVSIIYADQRIKDKKEFQNKLLFGHNLALAENKFVIIEVKAKYPNPNLGYVKIGKLLRQENNIEIYELDHFTEKPDYETAKKFVDSFKYLWNTGFYIWKTGFFLEQIKIHSPEIYTVLEQINDFNNCLEQYEKFPKISLDYALLEKMENSNVLIIPAELGWSDIGTWNTLYEEMVEEAGSNLTEGEVHHLDTKNSIIINKDLNKKVVLINVNNLVVINTPTEILICHKSEDKRIKEILEKFNNS